MFGSEIRDKDGVAATVGRQLVASVLPWLILSSSGNVRGDYNLTARTRENRYIISPGVI